MNLSYLDESDPDTLDEQYSEVSQEGEQDLIDRDVVFPEDYEELGLGPEEEPVVAEEQETRPNLVNANTIPRA